MRAVHALLLVPVPAIVSGILIAHRHGVPPSAFAVNGVAAALGSVIALGLLVGQPSRRASLVAGLIAISLLALTLASPGMEGVRRWVIVGPVRINVSEVVAPWVLWTIARTDGRPVQAVVLTAAATLIHVLQPDAGQATAFGLGAVVLFVRSSRGSRVTRAVGCAVALGGALLAWCRTDRLLPVAHVERVVHLAFATGPFAAAAAISALLLLAAPFVWFAQREWSRDATKRLASAFSAYIVTAIGVTELGNFPVPVLGAGASPVLGWYALLGLVLASSSQHVLLTLQAPQR
jgi:cell division protein FtsW (lipid II flippase)